jgi:homoserine O-acetyltransferase
MSRSISRRPTVEKDMARNKAKVLCMLSRTDKLHPQTIAADVVAKLEAAGITADYHEIARGFGVLAPGLDAAKWAPRLRAFMASLEKRN